MTVINSEDKSFVPIAKLKRKFKFKQLVELALQLIVQLQSNEIRKIEFRIKRDFKDKISYKSRLRLGKR